MTTRVQRWGNSLGLRLPKAAAREAGVTEGAEVDVRVEGGAIVVRALARPRRLAELLAGVSPENLHPAAVPDDRRGKESW